MISKSNLVERIRLLYRISFLFSVHLPSAILAPVKLITPEIPLKAARSIYSSSLFHKKVCEFLLFLLLSIFTEYPSSINLFFKKEPINPVPPTNKIFNN